MCAIYRTSFSDPSPEPETRYRKKVAVIKNTEPPPHPCKEGDVKCEQREKRAKEAKENGQVSWIRGWLKNKFYKIVMLLVRYVSLSF